MKPLPSLVALILLAASASCRQGGGASGGGSGPGTDPSPPPAGPGGTSPSTPGDPSSGGASEPPAPEPGVPAVQLVGRFDERDPAGPKCGWPGCRVIARFWGTEVSARLVDDSGESGPSEWDVAIDGRWSSAKLVLSRTARDYVLARDLPRGKHTVELYKRTEGQDGVTQFLGFDFAGGSLLPPPPRKTRRLEIVGDSDVAGFGYEGALGADCTTAPKWWARFENFRAAWGERLAQKLDAELNAVVFSGKGFYFNIWRPDLETIGVLYPRSNPIDPTSTFDRSTFVPDVEVVSIGGNDYNMGQPEDTGPAPLDGFTQKARELTSELRTSYPQAHIFLMAYAVLTDEYPPGRLRRTNVETALKTVVKEHEDAGDARVYFVAPPPSVPAELTACDGHGGPEYHERIAQFMAETIAAKAGW